MAKRRNRIFVLNEPNAPRLNPALANEIGLNESIILLQVEFWISISNNHEDGRNWTYQSVRDMKDKTFSFWSISTINRAINSLIDSGYLIEGNYNKKRYDKTRWFALNYEKLAELKSISVPGHDTGVLQNETGSSQNDTGSNQNETGSNQNDTPIPEITTETSSQTTSDKERSTSNTSNENILTTEKIEQIVNEWNKLNLQNLRSINNNTTRHTMLKARIKDYSFDEVIEAISSITDSEFLQGSNNRGWTITFDWLIRPNNFIKVLEGNYIDDKGGQNGGNKGKSKANSEEDRESGEISFSERAGITTF